MADENPVSPINAEQPPKADPLAKPAASGGSTLKLNPVIRKPLTGAGAALKPGLKLPPKPGATISALRPGLKLPPKPGTATQGALKAGLKLPAKPPMATQSALKSGLNLPARPQIRKPGETIAAKPLPKPVELTPVTPAAKAEPAAVEKPAPAPAPAAVPAPVAAAAPTPAVAPAPAPVGKVEVPVAKVDAQGVAKLPTVEMQAVKRDEPIVTPEPPKPMEALKSVTQKLKGITQAIPQQAILHKTGIIAEGATSDAQKEAAKHKTARISLADAIGAAPVKNENAPMKTIRIRRPIDIPGATKIAAPKAEEVPPAATNDATSAEATPASEPAPSVTQRKTLKISRPAGGVVRPAGKFGIKRPAAASAATAVKPEGGEDPAPVADIADIPEIADIPSLPPQFSQGVVASSSSDGPAWLCTLSSVVQLVACLTMGALAWYLYQNTQISLF